MKDRSNLEMAKNLTSYTLIFIVADAILLFMAKLLGHGFIYVIAYFLFLLGPMPFVVVEYCSFLGIILVLYDKFYVAYLD